MRPLRSLLLCAALASAACAPAETVPEPAPGAACAVTLAQGDPLGHPDPLGAKAAGQARAGRIDELSQVPQPAHGRQRVRSGDYLLINDKIAVVIEAPGLSDGYDYFGGGILAVDQVGDDGRPLGLSRYLESFVALGGTTINARSVTVLADGSDGGPAIVRALGRLQAISYLEDTPLTAIAPTDYRFEAACDYVLAPGSERLLLRLSVVNDSPEPVDFGLELPGSYELYGFFHYSEHELVTPELAYAEPEGSTQYVGFDGGRWGFAWRAAGEKLDYGLYLSGAAVFSGPGFIAEGCAATSTDHAELIAGGPEYDGLAEAIRRVDGAEPWREVDGTVRDAAGSPVADAWVHVLGEQNRYLGRTRTAADGTFSAHAPPGETAKLLAQKRGYPDPEAVVVEPDGSSADIVMPAHGLIEVQAVQEGTGEPLPVRIQVIPAVPAAATPEAWGVPDEEDGRLHQHFAMNGQATLVVPPGQHRVIVSHGYEWELHDETIDVAAGKTAKVTAALAHSVSSTGVMCADFHLHTKLSPDSNDSPELKAMGAVADGLEIPAASDHEWVGNLGPAIEKLGLTKWAFGLPAEELTTFSWGHFGIIGLAPDPEQFNGGAVYWVGKSPADAFALAHARPGAPLVIVNHPRAGAGGFFSAARYNRESGKGESDLWSDQFDAVEICNGSDFASNRDESVADWFSLLDHGYRLAGVGSSDNHHLRSGPVGYPRTCLYLGHDDPSALSWPDLRVALRWGRAVVSAGLFMTVLGPKGERPGSTVATGGQPVELTVSVQAPSWIEAESLETIVNGETVSVEPLAPVGGGKGHKYVRVVSVQADPDTPHNWVVFHAKGKGTLDPLHPGRRPFAVSNPVFLEQLPLGGR
ncbi:MAG: CehA/McbA family metallohydrolase [Deltaproteobacteria bacterium]|nr:CehA/McbA family metallohydrolase [Deltaproteobacteria bacterium]